MTNTPDLLGHAIFKDEYVIELERGIVVPILIESDDRQAHFFGKDFDRILFLVGCRRWCR